MTEDELVNHGIENGGGYRGEVELELTRRAVSAQTASVEWAKRSLFVLAGAAVVQAISSAVQAYFAAHPPH